MNKQELLDAIETKLEQEKESEPDKVQFIATIRKHDQRDGEWFEQRHVTVEKHNFGKADGIKATSGYSTMVHLNENDARQLAQAIIKLVL